MDWWHKIRKLLVALSARVKTRKTGGGDGDGVSTGSGLMKLREDVKACGYEDVEVMWNILSRMEMEQQQVASHSSKRTKKHPIWRSFFWSHHHRM
ncbi:hypothetical protein L1049_021694 [Liquidambar formosana]|uniref:Uncharacterized protein n=1 Tax=Liquidambar formosana TaxID=63359 RepID=A0AAP0WMW4_LIQFO